MNHTTECACPSCLRPDDMSNAGKHKREADVDREARLHTTRVVRAMPEHRKLGWPCRMTATTHTPDGRVHRIDRMIDGAGDLIGAVHRAVLSQRRPHIWYGVEIRALTPIGHRCEYVIDPDTLEIAPT